MQKGHSDTETQGIRVRVGAQYLPDQSDPDRAVYLYAYRVVIQNESQRTAQLLSRHWIISDALGERREVRGPGVVGEQPTLAPGEKFEYTSSSRLATDWGSMEGSYQMKWADGTLFDARIGRFFLARNLAPILPASSND